MLPESFGSLTQLTKLNLRGMPVMSLRPILALPSLEDVCFVLVGEWQQPGSVFPQSKRLTRLEVRGTGPPGSRLIQFPEMVSQSSL